jgi:hypothetical protein
MKKSLNLVLEEKDIIELMRILLDEDAVGALAFLKEHSKERPASLGHLGTSAAYQLQAVRRGNLSGFCGRPSPGKADVGRMRSNSL